MYKTPSVPEPGIPTPRTLATKERELREWESQLNERQELYYTQAGGTELRLKTLEGRIESKEQDLKHLDDQLKAKTATTSAEIKRLDKASADTKARMEAVRDTYMSAKAAQDALNARSKLLDESLAGVKSEIDERKKYQKEQEEVIDTKAREGNEELNRLNREVASFERDKEDLLGQVHSETLKASAVAKQIEARQNDLANLNLRYDEVSKEYRANLTEIKLEVAAAEDQRDRILAETSQQLLDLKAERAEIDATRQVVARQREEVSDEKRKLESLRVQYGM